MGYLSRTASSSQRGIPLLPAMSAHGPDLVQPSTMQLGSAFQAHVEDQQHPRDRVRSAWREEYVQSEEDAFARSRLWVLQTLCGKERECIDDLQFLAIAAKQVNRKPRFERCGFDVEACLLLLALCAAVTRVTCYVR